MMGWGGVIELVVWWWAADMHAIHLRPLCPPQVWGGVFTHSRLSFALMKVVTGGRGCGGVMVKKLKRSSSSIV